MTTKINKLEIAANRLLKNSGFKLQSDAKKKTWRRFSKTKNNF